MNTHQKAVPRFVFVCCQEREGGPPACGRVGADNLLALRKSLDRIQGKEADAIEPVACGCLGFCSVKEGVVYDPESGRIWSGVRIQDTETLAEILVSCPT